MDKQDYLATLKPLEEQARKLSDSEYPEYLRLKQKFS